MNNSSGFLGFGFAIIILTDFVSSETTKNMYESCKPLSCANNGPNITYPFYIVGQQDESCGFPPFNGVQCEEGNPIYTTRGLLGGGLGNSYIIRNISDYGTSVRLVTNATLDENCPIPLQNMSYPSHLFTVSTSDDDGKTMIAFLCFFHGCNNATPLNATEIHCGTNSRSYVVGLGSDRSCNKLKWSGNYSCSSVMEFPVEVDRNEKHKLDQFTKGIDSVKLLNGGFSLKMNWSRDGCLTCERSGGRCGYDATATRSVCHCKDRTHLTACRDDNNNNSSSPAAAIHPKTSGNGRKLMQIGLGVGIGGLAVIGLIFSIYMIRCRRRSKSSFSKNTYADDSFGGSNIYFEVPIFTNGELERATNNFNFSNELGDGGYGIVYYGKLRDGREVAVKRLYEHSYRRVKQFMTEVQILTRLRHTNLVSLYGCTSRRSQELLLVYEYVPNGTVADHLHGNRAKPGSLPWPVRMNISLETAKALAYLHKEGIIHRDVKTNNILLDKNFSVKVGDFGLSRLRPTDVTHVSTAPQGTPGYVDPEYHLCYQLTEKSDVYSFGVVLMELVSSMPAVDISRDRHEINLANLAVNRIQKRAVDELIDPNLKCESDDKIKSMVTAVIELSFRCLQQDREIRPTMDEVVEELENAVRRVEESCDSIGKSRRFLTSPESDETGLLNSVKFLTSPVSVIGQNWTSSSSSSTTSINSKTPFSTL